MTIAQSAHVMHSDAIVSGDTFQYLALYATMLPNVVAFVIVSV